MGPSSRRERGRLRRALHERIPGASVFGATARPSRGFSSTPQPSQLCPHRAPIPSTPRRIELMSLRSSFAARPISPKMRTAHDDACRNPGLPRSGVPANCRGGPLYGRGIASARREIARRLPREADPAGRHDLRPDHDGARGCVSLRRRCSPRSVPWRSRSRPTSTSISCAGPRRATSSRNAVS